MKVKKRNDLSTGWKLGVMMAAGCSPEYAQEKWLALIDGKCQRDVLDIHAAVLFGEDGETFGDFMAQRFPVRARGVAA
jgi:hypothetical protein